MKSIERPRGSHFVLRRCASHTQTQVDVHPEASIWYWRAPPRVGPRQAWRRQRAPSVSVERVAACSAQRWSQAAAGCCSKAWTLSPSAETAAKLALQRFHVLRGGQGIRKLLMPAELRQLQRGSAARDLTAATAPRPPRTQAQEGRARSAHAAVLHCWLKRTWACRCWMHLCSWTGY